MESWRIWTPLLTAGESGAEVAGMMSDEIEMLSYSPGGLDLPKYAQVLHDTDFDFSGGNHVEL